MSLHAGLWSYAELCVIDYGKIAPNQLSMVVVWRRWGRQILKLFFFIHSVNVLKDNRHQAARARISTPSLAVDRTPPRHPKHTHKKGHWHGRWVINVRHFTEKPAGPSCIDVTVLHICWEQLRCPLSQAFLFPTLQMHSKWLKLREGGDSNYTKFVTTSFSPNRAWGEKKKSLWQQCNLRV